MNPLAISSFWRQSLHSPIVTNISWKEISLPWREKDILILFWYLYLVVFKLDSSPPLVEPVVRIRIARLIPYIRWACVWVMRHILNLNRLPSFSVLSSKKKQNEENETLRKWICFLPEKRYWNSHTCNAAKIIISSSVQSISSKRMAHLACS